MPPDIHATRRPVHLAPPLIAMCTCFPVQLSGRVVWTGNSSMDLAMELEQAGERQLTALFTFVARDPLTGAPCRIPSVLPQTPEVRLWQLQRWLVTAQCVLLQRQEGVCLRWIWSLRMLLPIWCCTGHRSVSPATEARLFRCALPRPQDQALFAERQAINAARKAARKAGGGKPHQGAPSKDGWTPKRAPS